MTRGRFGGHVPLLPPLGSGTENAYRADSYVRLCDTLCTFQAYKTLWSDLKLF